MARREGRIGTLTLSTELERAASPQHGKQSLNASADFAIKA
jgi:hypothetical protein